MTFNTIKRVQMPTTISIRMHFTMLDLQIRIELRPIETTVFESAFHNWRTQCIQIRLAKSQEIEEKKKPSKTKKTLSEMDPHSPFKQYFVRILWFILQLKMESPSDLANSNSKSVKFMAHFTRWDSLPPFETNDHF